MERTRPRIDYRKKRNRTAQTLLAKLVGRHLSSNPIQLYLIIIDYLEKKTGKQVDPSDITTVKLDATHKFRFQGVPNMSLKNVKQGDLRALCEAIKKGRAKVILAVSILLG